MDTTGLKEWLAKRRKKFTDMREGSGGCETCGYGAEEIEELDFDALLTQIDEFSKQFSKP